MTAPRVSEKECELACSYFHNYGLAKDCISRLLAERAALEAKILDSETKRANLETVVKCYEQIINDERHEAQAKLADARKEFAREALALVVKGDDNGTTWESWAGVIEWLRAVAEKEGA